MGTGEHFVARQAVISPVRERHLVDRAHLPLLQRIDAARFEPLLLLGLGDIEIEFEKLNSGAFQHLLEDRDHLHEFLILALATETHDPLDPGAVVPGAIEEDHFLRRWKIGDIALEIPGAAIPIRGDAQGHHAGIARAQMLDDALDRPILACPVAALEKDEDPLLVADDLALKLDELDLERVQTMTVSRLMCFLGQINLSLSLVMSYPMPGIFKLARGVLKGALHRLPAFRARGFELVGERLGPLPGVIEIAPRLLPLGFRPPME